MQLEERGVVEQPLDQRVHVVRALRVVGQQGPQVLVRPDLVEVEHPLLGEQGGRIARDLQRFGVRCSGDVYDAAAAAVRVRAAEGLHVHVLAGDRADDVRPGDEHSAAGRHDHQVGQRRAVRGAAGGRAEHDRDLRHPAGGPDHRLEHQTYRVQRLDALGQPRAAGVPQPDDRHSLAHREVDRVDDVPAAFGAHRTAHHRGIGAEGDGRGTVDGAAGAEHAARVARAEQPHRVRVEQPRQPQLRIARVALVGEGGGGERGHLDS